MHVRYYRINRLAYTVGELSAITVGPRKLLLPVLIARLFLFKLIGKPFPVGDPIADIRMISPLDALEAEKIRKRHVIFQAAESALPGLGFTQFRFIRGDDPRSPYENYSLIGIDGSGSIAVACTVMCNERVSANWVEIHSLVADGRTLRSSNHALAGILRPVPSAIIRRMPGASWHDLLQFHIDEVKRVRSQGSRFEEGMCLDQVVQADREYYRDQVAHWVETGLLIPEQQNGAD